MTTSHEELVLISGASTGMGAAAARELAGRGYHVLAGVRREADFLHGPNLESVFLDVTDPAQIEAVARRIATDPRRRPLRAVINNAGIAINAPVELLSMDEWRRQFEVNFFGHVAVTKAVLPALHASSGRVVNISSVGGKVALPTYGAYAGAKFAMEGMSDALRRELAPHGVQVVVVEPGGVQTEMTGHGIDRMQKTIATMSATERTRYGALLQAIINQATAFTASGLPAERAGRIIADATTARRPRARYTIGRDAAVLTRLPRLLTDRLLDRMMAASLRPHFPKSV
ncbi:SDR family oxidoreductase [Actinoplanes derwentensis]|uniref:NADP-dependent 3-hydroxy acid dehydrogenase YdfG n=1 Tax=Actinoplanes derwentensis TaxID=113562 RepID=A0A1H1Y5E8_9ACTN|nr:SDR family oxidoreductase [Actinoplanes derwentensis]GID86729.1 short-chain dehydrogenase [Actinoplanes derwentensis]SDT16256.1 NADP-dependent 3-hydroxy acid dehydrogenase YdfG [Actinoplanes derwentensis]